MKKQVMEYAGGNEMAATAVKQMGYDLMGYYPITPSTQIAEQLDQMRAEGKTDIIMIAAEGEHSAAGICYGASAAGGRVFNATSANGLLYALEQFPVQSGTRYPMVMNVACRTVSGPLSIKCDHSDLMYMLNTGWIILFANRVQQVYDFNIIALKLAEAVRLPAVVAFDGFFTSHQKRRCYRYENDRDVKDFLGDKRESYSLLDMEHPISIGSYMNEPDLIYNRFEIHQAMEQARVMLPQIYQEYQQLSGRKYEFIETCQCEDAKTILIILGSSFHTAKEGLYKLRKEGKKVGLITLNILRPFPSDEICDACEQADNIIIADRQDSYGAKGGNFSLEIRAAIQRRGMKKEVKTVIYGLGGMDFFPEDAVTMFDMAKNPNISDFSYYKINNTEKESTEESNIEEKYFKTLKAEKTKIGIAQITKEESGLTVKGITLNNTTKMPKRIAPGHGACPGCGIPVNLNLLLRAIEDPVVLLFQTGCGMIVTTAYPKTSFKVPYIHNLFQNGAATLSGIAEMCYRKQRKGEIPSGEIVFIMVSGDGGLDIGMGSALGTALRGHKLLIFEYDNGGYMNTGYQLSYSTPKGAKSSTSHIGENQYGKTFFHKDMPQIMVAANIPYVATAAESNPVDFMNKAAKAAYYAKKEGTAYMKAISACPLNWNDKPDTERQVIAAAVDSCYFPLYEVEQGITKLNYNPEAVNKKIPIEKWLSMMGRTKHLIKQEYKNVVESLQNEVDRRFELLKIKDKNPYL